MNDIRHRYSHYKTDFLDGLHPQCLASTIFLFFACITPIVTFGGLMGHKTDGYMVRSLLSEFLKLEPNGAGEGVYGIGRVLRRRRNTVSV